MSSAERRYFGLRVALWYAVLFVAGSAVVAVLAYYLTAASLAQRDRQDLEAKLGEYATVYANGGLRALAETVRAEQYTAPERLIVRIVGGGTETLVLSMPEGWDPSSIERASLRLPDGTMVEVGKSAEPRRELLARFRVALALVTFAVIGIAVAGGWLVTREAVRPIARLTEAVRRIVDTGRTDARVPVTEHDDAIRELTTMFNAMLERIESLVAGMRGALDNVSHDLRTPLTRLRASAEMALASSPDPEAYREALADCLEETDRVLVMLDTLMDISEAESGAMSLRKESVVLSEVVERAVELYRDVADAKGVRLDAGPLDPVVVVGDRVRLEQVAANLLDNAIKYTDDGGEVRASVSLEPDGLFGRFEVRDTGAGIPADELPRIWERLYRGDRSRAERGLGLGLSLVKAVVEAHAGTASAESAAGKGSVFIVRLPLAPGNLSPM